MKKGCLIALIAIALLALVGAAILGIAYAKANTRMGLTEAPSVSHETVAAANTVLRIVFKPETMIPLLDKLIPADQIPTMLTKLGYTPEKLLPMLLPREIAVLGTPNLASNKLNLTFFINEKRGGPFLVDAINNGTYTPGRRPLDSFPKIIQWESEGAALPQRGEFEIRGNLSIPDSVEAAILKSWKPTPPAEPLRIEGNHHFEAVMDNRNGNILTLYAAVMAAQGQDWEAPLKDSQIGPMIDGVLPDIIDIRAAADLLDFDTATVNLRVDATAEKGPALEFVAKMVWPTVLDAATKQGITLKGDPAWDPQKGALIIDLYISGIKPMLEKSLKRSLPGPTAAQNAKQPSE